MFKNLLRHATPILELRRWTGAQRRDSGRALPGRCGIWSKRFARDRTPIAQTSGGGANDDETRQYRHTAIQGRRYESSRIH